MPRPKPTEEQVILSVQVPKSLRKGLEQMAEAKGMKVPELVRKLLEGAVVPRQKRSDKT